MTALDEILARKPETFEEANALDEILSRPEPGAGGNIVAGLGPVAPPASEQFKRKFTLPGEGVGFTESLKLGFIDDFGAKAARTAERMFPGDPDAVKRFGVVGGDLVFVNEQGQLERVKSGFKDAAGTVASFTPEIAGSVAGATVGSPLFGSALGATGGKAFKEIIGAMIFDDPTTTVDVLQSLGLEFVTDFAAGGIGKAFTKGAERKAIEGVTDVAFKSEARRESIKGATGIELDLAQITNLPKLKDLKRWARNFPGDAAEVIKANDEMIAGQVDRAIERLVNKVAKPSDTAVLGTDAINAAQAAITAARTEVANAAKPLYDRAFADTVSVDTKPVLAILDEQLKTAKGSQATALRQARRLMNVPGTKQVDESVRGLHATVLAINEMFEKRGSEALGSTTRRSLVEVKESLLKQLSEASPAYDEARRAFAEGTEALVDPLQNGIVGVLAKVTDQKAATAAAKMFADGNVNAIAIKQAREAIQKESPAAWDGIVKQWLMHQFSKASKEIQTGESINVAGKFRQAVIGTRAQKAAMEEALGPEAKILFDQTMAALQMVARTPTASSATEFNRMITNELGTSVGSATRAVLQPRQTVIAAIDQRFLESQAIRIAEALTDPGKREQLKMLQKVSPGQARANIAASIIGIGLPGREFVEDFLEFDVKPEVLNE